MRFVAVDVETANARMRSICQIGIVVFEDGQEVHAESRLVNPKEDFAPVNVGIHGITAEHVAEAATFAELDLWLGHRFAGELAVSHSPFDRSALFLAAQHHSIEPLRCDWLDSVRVGRHAWPDTSGGYGLANLARALGISFRHHDALEDARAAGLIVCRAMRDTGLDLVQLYDQCKVGAAGKSRKREAREGNADGPLSGETIVFTGALSMQRSLAADMADKAGARVHPGVTKDTTMLVVGDGDLDPAERIVKTSKHVKAEGLVAKGQPIRFLAESDFVALVDTDHTPE